jgi:hypothetical protein
MPEAHSQVMSTYPIHPSFLGILPILQVLRELPQKNRLGRQMSQVFPSHKIYCDISNNSCEHFDFSTVGENIYRNRPAKSQPITRRNWRRRDV